MSTKFPTYPYGVHLESDNPQIAQTVWNAPSDDSLVRQHTFDDKTMNLCATWTRGHNEMIACIEKQHREIHRLRFELSHAEKCGAVQWARAEEQQGEIEALRQEVKAVREALQVKSELLSWFKESGGCHS